MKPAPFDYVYPESLEDALETLQRMVEEGLDVKVIAGGQSLVPLLNMRLATPDLILDLNALAQDLSYIRHTGDQLHIGALTRHFALAESSLISRTCPVMTEAESLIGHLQIRTRGTIGGSLAHADPSAELPLVLTVLDGIVVLRSSSGVRQLSAHEFFLSYLMTSAEPNELITEVILPALPPQSGQSLQEFSLRHGDFAIVAAAAQVTLDNRGQLLSGRLAVGGAAPTPIDASSIFNQYKGQVLTDEVIQDAISEISAFLDPADDLHASASYRVDLANTLGFRAVKTAAERARTRASATQTPS